MRLLSSTSKPTSFVSTRRSCFDLVVFGRTWPFAYRLRTVTGRPVLAPNSRYVMLRLYFAVRKSSIVINLNFRSSACVLNFFSVSYFTCMSQILEYYR